MFFETIVFFTENIFLQVKGAVDKRNTEIKKLEKRINEIVDRIYRDFSKSVGVANIREYEENQLKDAQNMADERLSLSSQLAKLKYQYACLFFIFLSINTSTMFVECAGNVFLGVTSRAVIS